MVFLTVSDQWYVHGFCNFVTKSNRYFVSKKFGNMFVRCDNLKTTFIIMLESGLTYILLSFGMLKKLTKRL